MYPEDRPLAVRRNQTFTAGKGGSRGGSSPVLIREDVVLRGSLWWKGYIPRNAKTA